MATKKTKILHIISSLTRGGRERQLAIIVANTVADQYPTKIIYFNKYQNSYTDEYGLNNIAIQIKSHGKMARLKELNRILQREQPDVVYSWGNGESISIFLLKPFHKFKFINGSVRHGVRSKKYSHYVRTLVLHLSEYVVANSKAGLKANKLRRGLVLYNGVDEKFIEPLSNRTEKRKSLTGLSEETPLFISAANLVPHKDYFTILRAFSQLKKEKRKFYYLILGDGPMFNEIQNRIKDYGLTENIQIVGNIENVSDYLKISDIFIHSSKGEGCSNAILEAMAAGLTVITTNTGGTPEIVTKETGLLYDYKNHQQLNSHIKYLIENMDIAMKMGQNGMQLIREKFSVKTMMNNYFNIIDEVFTND